MAALSHASGARMKDSVVGAPDREFALAHRAVDVAACSLGRRLLLARFPPHGIPKSHAGAAAVLGDEFDASCFESALNDVHSCSPRCVNARLKLSDCDDSDTRDRRQLRLAPGEKSAGSSRLLRSNHIRPYGRCCVASNQSWFENPIDMSF